MRILRKPEEVAAYFDDSPCLMVGIKGATKRNDCQGI